MCYGLWTTSAIIWWDEAKCVAEKGRGTGKSVHDGKLLWAMVKDGVG